MDEITFASEQELYKRVKPALRAKKKELERLGFPYIKEEEIWQFLKGTKWKKEKGLMLADVVSDILHLENQKIDRYVKQQWEERTKQGPEQEGLEVI